MGLINRDYYQYYTHQDMHMNIKNDQVYNIPCNGHLKWYKKNDK